MFDSVTTGEEVVNQKPAPDIFVRAMEKMNMDPGDCLVFEDSLSGVTAAKEAGIKAVAIDPSGERGELDEANLVVEGFSEITPKVVDQL